MIALALIPVMAVAQAAPTEEVDVSTAHWGPTASLHALLPFEPSTQPWGLGIEGGARFFPTGNIFALSGLIGGEGRGNEATAHALFRAELAVREVDRFVIPYFHTGVFAGPRLNGQGRLGLRVGAQLGWCLFATSTLNPRQPPSTDVGDLAGRALLSSNAPVALVGIVAIAGVLSAQVQIVMDVTPTALGANETNGSVLLGLGF